MHNDKHWANETTMLRYFDKVLIPYIDEVRREDNLASTQPALVIFDHFKGQVTDRVFPVLEKNSIMADMVPANCTDRLQPIDLGLNKSIKDSLQASYGIRECNSETRT